MLAGVAVALFAVTFVLMRVVKGLVAAVTTVVGPLLKLLGVLAVVAVVLMAALFARDTPAPPPQSLTKGLLVAADK
jgi:hypothetical protein